MAVMHFGHAALYVCWRAVAPPGHSGVLYSDSAVSVGMIHVTSQTLLSISHFRPEDDKGTSVEYASSPSGAFLLHSQGPNWP